jgi:hypothetical protein
VPEPAPAPPTQLQEQLANITVENSSFRISGVVHEVMYVTSLNSPRAGDRPAADGFPAAKAGLCPSLPRHRRGTRRSNWRTSPPRIHRSGSRAQSMNSCISPPLKFWTRGQFAHVLPEWFPCMLKSRWNGTEVLLKLPGPADDAQRRCRSGPHGRPAPASPRERGAPALSVDPPPEVVSLAGSLSRLTRNPPLAADRP